jgi:LmbE family N-acetylglucosaminyl deacetylase
MAVHAHPDDEVIGTGGTLARYSAEGVRTVLVTCTNGEQGDAPGGIKPGELGHDPALVASLRLNELKESVAHLGVSHLEVLGYPDSGMAGWSANDNASAFCNLPLSVAAEQVAQLMLRYRPQVVVTYDDNGGYGHPDHIQAHRAAVAAAESTGVPEKLYYAALPRSAFGQLRQQLESVGIDSTSFGVPEDFGVPDELVTTVIDVSAYVEPKRRALSAHASQMDNFFFTQLPEEVLEVVLAREWFTLRSGHAREAEDDLFAGLR